VVLDIIRFLTDLHQQIGNHRVDTLEPAVMTVQLVSQNQAQYSFLGHGYRLPISPGWFRETSVEYVSDDKVSFNALPHFLLSHRHRVDEG